jgi:hypothetical protein
VEAPALLVRRQRLHRFGIDRDLDFVSVTRMRGNALTNVV